MELVAVGVAQELGPAPDTTVDRDVHVRIAEQERRPARLVVRGQPWFGCDKAAGRRRTRQRASRTGTQSGAKLAGVAGRRRSWSRPYRLPRRACSRSIASNRALKLPSPKPRAPSRWMISKNT